MMKRISNACVWCWLTICLLLPASSVVGELRAGLSETVIEELDSVQLVVRDIGTRQSETPELSGLDADFHVLGVNTSSQYRFVNGRAQSWVDYQITLQPKHTGELIIPSIGIGQSQTEPLRLSVRQLSESVRRKIDSRVFYELELSSESVYVQSQLLLTRRLVYADGVQLYGGQLETPVLQNAQIFELGEGQSSVIERDGRPFGSYEQQYAILPEQSGALIIPSDSVTASVRVSDGLSTSRKTVRVSTPEQEITVLPIPTSYPQDKAWLPAIAVTATQRFEPSLATRANVGDTIKRSLVITVIGNTGTSVEPTNFVLNDTDFKTYAQPAVIENDLLAENLVGRRGENIDLVPISPGALRLPGTEITWWNTDTDELMVTTLEDRALSVVGSAIADDETLPLNDRLAETRSASALLDDDGSASLTQVGGTVTNNANALDWRTGLTIVVAFAIAWLLWRKLNIKPRGSLANTAKPSLDRIPDTAIHAARRESIPALSLRALMRAIESSPPSELRRDLNRYLAAITGSPQRQALVSFKESSHEADTVIRALNAACFGSGSWEAQERSTAIECVKVFSRGQNKTNDKTGPALPPLYSQ